MGEVYLARDLFLEREVAIKLLPPDRAENRDSRRRFLQEAQAAARLDHPGICPVFDVGEAPDGRTYIAMPFIDGETLATRLERGALPVREALSIVQHLADALAAAHARGIVHRDLKPQNVMVTRSGLPKLLDFGVAKLKPGGLAAMEASTASGDTSIGAVVGTPSYMAPEQVAGAEVDTRCDLFALGAVLFECVTGQRAFQGQNVLDIAAAIAHLSPPPVSSLRRDVPSGVDELCARLLAKEPADRFQSADEVVGATRLLLGGSSRPDDRPSRPARRHPSWRRVASATLAVTVGLGGAYGMLRWRPRLPDPPPQAVRWYERGTDFIREGAYHSANEALEQALREFPDYPIAYARQAEALAELDDQTRAGERLLRMQTVLGDEARLPEEDRLRLRGIRSTVLRELSQAVDAYRDLAEKAPTDAGVWVDLGRAQEAAELRTDARVSYGRAIAIDPGLAPAHLRLAGLEAFNGRRDTALPAFAEAERLYRAASNVEGEIEVLLRRGMFLDVRNELSAARRDLERTRELADGVRSLPHVVRATLALGSVTASEGKTDEAERLIGDAIDAARRSELWTLVAEGLIDAAGILVNTPSRWQEADELVQQAEQLAQQKGSRRTASRASLQRAALALQRLDPKTAKTLATDRLDFLRTNGYRRLELTALTIIARAERGLGNLTAARATAAEALDGSRSLGDGGQVSQALASLAGIAAALGDFPAALKARDEAEALNRAAGNQEILPFDLANRAELLILIGRGNEAEPLLAELDDGVARGLEVFRGRTGRALYLRALRAVVVGDAAMAAEFARRAAASATNSASAMGSRALLDYAEALLGRRTRVSVAPSPMTLSADERAELEAWAARAAVQRRDRVLALDLAQRGLTFANAVGNDELAWRLAAVGYVAAAGTGRVAEAALMRAAAVSARKRLSEQWGPTFATYEARQDLASLRSRVVSINPGDRP